MAPRAYWKGSLKLSLVSCPVVLYPASTTVEKTRFHMINKETGNRLKQQMVDSETGDVVESDQKGRGYELSKGEYVEIEKEELEAVQVESNHTIEIESFVPRDEIDKRYLNHPYYIAPDGKAGIDAFAVIRDAMKDKDRVALARIVLSNREHVMAIEPLGKGLLGTTLRYPYELRDEGEYFDDIKNPKISKDMIELASHILDSKAAHFDPSKFKDEYENALKTLVKRKAAGKPVKVVEPHERPDNVINLMDALRQSLKGKAPAKRASHASSRTSRRTSRQEGASLDGTAAQGELNKRRPSNEFGPRCIFLVLRELLLLRRFALRFFARLLLRHLLSRFSCLRKTDRDRLLAALDLLARAAALQRAGLALLHRALDLGGRAFGIFSCHEVFSRL
jgi:Ku protein